MGVCLRTRDFVRLSVLTRTYIMCDLRLVHTQTYTCARNNNSRRTKLRSEDATFTFHLAVKMPAARFSTTCIVSLQRYSLYQTFLHLLTALTNQRKRAKERKRKRDDARENTERIVLENGTFSLAATKSTAQDALRRFRPFYGRL